MATTNAGTAGQVIFQSRQIQARFVEGKTNRVVVCFPDRDHPVGFDQIGWAERFLSARNISAIYISLARIDWFQCSDFFLAMAACRSHLAADRPLTTYGSSMGGYGAILAAKALAADHCLALSPQYSIDPDKVPFERRYNQHAAEIGRFQHDLAAQVSDHCAYVVGLDPTHGLDKRHLRLIARDFNLRRLPVYGAGHGVLPMLSGADARHVLASYLAGEANLSALRQAIRDDRHGAKGYHRRMTNKRRENRHGELTTPPQTVALRPDKAAAGKRPKLVVHCGLPKTGTTSLQAYFYAHAKAFQAVGIYYPTQGADPKDRNHAWLSRQLRDGSVHQLAEKLASCPNDCHTIFLSDESLFVEQPGLSDAALAGLAQAVQDYDTEVVLFERDMQAWKRSFYLQSVQNRRAGPKTKHASARNLWQTSLGYDEFFAQAFCQELLNGAKMRARLAAAFGTDKVTLLEFDKARDVVGLFCHAMGWPEPGQGVTLDRNRSISEPEAEILRQANALKDGQSRLVKALLALPDGFDPAAIKPQRLQKLAKQAGKFPWFALSFQANPPLQISRQAFDLAKAKLMARAKRLQDAR